MIRAALLTLALSPPDTIERPSEAFDPVAHGPSRRECIFRFAVAGTVCGLSIVFPNPGTAIACASGIIVNFCSCAKKLGIEDFCDWD